MEKQIRELIEHYKTINKELDKPEEQQLIEGVIEDLKTIVGLNEKEEYVEGIVDNAINDFEIFYDCIRNKKNRSQNKIVEEVKDKLIELWVSMEVKK